MLAIDTRKMFLIILVKNEIRTFINLQNSTFEKIQIT